MTAKAVGPQTAAAVPVIAEAGLFRVEAYAFASRFNLREVGTWLPAETTQRAAKTQIVAEWSKASKLFAYDYGALVFFQAPGEQCAEVTKRFQAMLPREPHPPLREDFLVEVRPGAPIEATFDRLVVPTLTDPLIEVVATVVSQSVSLDYYDEDAQAILDRIGQIATDVSREGRAKGRTRDLVRFVGAAIASQVEIISAISLLDAPDLTWEDELADRVYTKMRTNFEVPERYRALEAKLVTIREALAAFLELTSTRRALWLEATVVVLIFVEIVLGLWARAH